MAILPFRPLEVRGHGVYDPKRNAFYPFQQKLTSAGNFPAKPGIRYYIHRVTGGASRTGINAAVLTPSLSVMANGQTTMIVYGILPITTAASDFAFFQVEANNLGILCDPNSAVTNTSFTYTYMTFAEIPAEASSESKEM